MGPRGDREDAQIHHTVTSLSFLCELLLSSSQEFKYAIANCSLIYQCNLYANLLIKLPGKKLLMWLFHPKQQIYSHFQLLYQH